ncbi:uncharacterized protein LOC124145983 [Haliotis rufescens]|uniref:uncharacterized protein LOC124145983 n=1 Tax=Haliotis rufescens TaxID=6454 RepID=UPI001EAF9C9F|nr:uncharacterized protein LOC124145983 [Haliotis rufescens]
MMGTPLLLLFLIPLTSAINDICRERMATVNHLQKRWPFIKGEGSMDDSTLEPKAFSANDQGSLLEYAPGVGYCGGKYPIWRKERGDGVSVVCIQNETSTCFKEMEIVSKQCQTSEVYRLSTDVVGSVFCFQPNACKDEPCQNGGNCTSTLEGFSCSCPDGFSGPTCQGDPCSNTTMLPSIDKRQAEDNKVSLNDQTLQAGWYAVPRGMKLLDQRPKGRSGCSSWYPIYAIGRKGDQVAMCTGTPYTACAGPFVTMVTKCEDREVYGIFKRATWSAYCFECNPGPVDLLIIEDVSSSVEKHDNDKAHEFVMNFVNGSSISKEESNVAFITFSSKARVGFNLNTYDNKTNVLSALSSQWGTGGGTYLDPAIKLANANIYTESRGDRPDARNVVLIITDGKYKDDAVVSIQALHAKAEVFVVTVTSSVDKAGIAKIASSKDHIFDVGGALSSISTAVFDPYCNSTVPA